MRYFIQVYLTNTECEWRICQLKFITISLLVKLFPSSISSMVLSDPWRTTACLARDENVLLKKLMVFCTWLLIASVSICPMVVLVIYNSHNVKFAKTPDVIFFISLLITLNTRDGMTEGWAEFWGARPPDLDTLNIWLGNSLTVELKIVIFMRALLPVSKLPVYKLRFFMSWKITVRVPDLKLPLGTVNFWQFLMINLFLLDKLPVVFAWKPEFFYLLCINE